MFLFHRLDLVPMLLDLSVMHTYCELRHRGDQAGKQQVRSTWRPWSLFEVVARKGRSPRDSWVWVKPLLLGKGQAPSLSQLTAWQIKLGLRGHLHTSCWPSTGDGSTFFGVRYNASFILRSRISVPKSREKHTIFYCYKCILTYSEVWKLGF